MVWLLRKPASLRPYQAFSILAYTYPSVVTMFTSLYWACMFFGIWERWNRTNWGSGCQVSKYMLEQLAVQYFASGVETTELRWVLMVVRLAP